MAANGTAGAYIWPHPINREDELHVRYLMPYVGTLGTLKARTHGHVHDISEAENVWHK